MSALKQVQDGVARTWDALTAGWRELSQRTAHALTRFYPAPKQGTVETFEERRIRRGSPWGVLAADVVDDDDWVEVTLEAPGMDPSSFQVDLFGNHLRIRGEKRFESHRSRGGFTVMERAYGQFERWIPLPTEVDDEGAQAQYRHGVLSVRLPKYRRGRVQRIRVRT